MKIYLETVGCQMNRLDSELISGQLASMGHVFTEDIDSAEIVLFNTCSVRAQAENKIYSRLGRELVRQEEHVPRIVGVLGCMAQRQQDDLRKRYPCIDIICSPAKLHKLPELIQNAIDGKKSTACDPARKEGKKVFLEDNPELDKLDHSRDPLSETENVQSFVRVMRGCDNFCTYCIVPFVRGPEVSRKPEDIIEEIKRLVDAGKSEITLLGQTVNSYKYNKGEQNLSFSDLLYQTTGIEGVKRLRFVTSYPTDFGNDVLEAMRDLPNICRYIHIPAQHGSDKMLKAMNRKYTRAQYDDLIDRCREFLPDVTLAGDFIVGFPGETEEDHQASKDLIIRSQYKNSFIFKYSPRPGTIAARTLEDNIPFEIKRKRNNELLTLQNEVSLTHHRGLIGQTLEVLVEGPSIRSGKQLNATDNPDEVQLVGRTRGDHITVFNGSEALAGKYVNVKIDDAAVLTLMGTLIEK